MKSKIYDYNKSDFWTKKDIQGNIHYYLRVKNEYVEVSKEVYRTCQSSYDKLKYDMRRKVEKSVMSYDDEYVSTFFVCKNIYHDLNQQIYIHDLAELAVHKIVKLPPKYREIAICLFIDEMTLVETSDYLHMPYSTIRDRKIKIQKILQDYIKKSDIY